jgi:hypothetical protein
MKDYPMKTAQMFLACGCITVAELGTSSTASAELYSRANGTMIYDSDRNITWLADANYAATLFETSCGARGVQDGGMGQPSAVEFVRTLEFVGLTGWRLPSTLEVDETCDVQAVTGWSSYHCTGGEMGHLFYQELGGQARQRLTEVNNQSVRLFKNLQAATYWTGTSFSPVPQIGMNFQTSDGVQNANSKSVKLLAWPVRDGDVGDLGKNQVAPNWKTENDWQRWKDNLRTQNQCP